MLQRSFYIFFRSSSHCSNGGWGVTQIWGDGIERNQERRNGSNWHAELYFSAMDIAWEPHSYLMGSSPFSHSKKKKNEIKLQCYGMFKNTSAVHKGTLLSGGLDGKRVGGEWIHIYVYIRLSPETITTLLIGCAAKSFQSCQTLCDPVTVAC